jgi:hypothetical protein
LSESQFPGSTVTFPIKPKAAGLPLKTAIVRLLDTALVAVINLPAQIPANLPPLSTFLKANSTIKQVATDGQGYIYVYGKTKVNSGNGYPMDVFIAPRLDPAAANVTYTVDIGGSSITRAVALAVDTAGNAYVTGWTNSPDFPTVPSAANPATSSSELPFVSKVSPNGQIVYSTLFSNGVNAIPQSIAIDSSGDAIVSGTAGALPATSGAYNNSWTSIPPFVTKLDPSGTKLLFSVSGVGGSSLVLDPAGNIYIAGTTSPELFPTTTGPQYPTTPGAFQTSYTPFAICPPTPCMIPITDGQQYVTKLSADGSKLLYSTFVTGSLGSYNAGMAVDSVAMSGSLETQDRRTIPIRSPSHPHRYPARSQRNSILQDRRCCFRSLRAYRRETETTWQSTRRGI